MSKNQNQSKNTYSLMVSCSNCGYRGTVNIPMGTTVCSSTCPHCGCRTISNYSFTNTEPRMKYVDELFDPVDRGLRPSKFPWLNTVMSTTTDKCKCGNTCDCDDCDCTDDLSFTYFNDNGKEDFSVKLNGKEVNLDDKSLNRAVDKVLKELGL